MYMLHKIIYKNFKSNIREYILFFVSNIIAVAELFIFWGLNEYAGVQFSCLDWKSYAGYDLKPKGKGCTESKYRYAD